MRSKPSDALSAPAGFGSAAGIPARFAARWQAHRTVLSKRLRAGRARLSRWSTPQHVALVLLSSLVLAEAFLLSRRSTSAGVAPPVAVQRPLDVGQRVGTAGTVGVRPVADARIGATAAATARLTVRTEPPGATVVVDGKRYGVSPVTLSDLLPGDHDVVIRTRHGELRQAVAVAAGESASMVVPLAAVPPAVPPAGRPPGEASLVVRAPIELRIFEGGELVGTSAMQRIALDAGSHTVTLKNEDVGFEQSRTVSVKPGKPTTLTVDMPQQRVAVNAVPWAEVLVDQRRVGETPLGALTLPVGPHVLLFRHPQLGEKTVHLVVRGGEAARVSVDMRKQ